MIKSISVVAAALAFAVLVPAAEANADGSTAHPKAAHHLHHAHYKHRHAAAHRKHTGPHQVRIVYADKYGVLRLGRRRAGPPYGYKFGFATYAGDPFASDDYFDGHRCYYLHRRDFCLSSNRPLDPFSSVNRF